MRFYPATCAAWVFLFAGTVLTIAGETAFTSHGILFPAPTTHQAARAARLNTILMEGWKLTPMEAIQLETALARNPGNMPMRLRLISYYCQHTFQERWVRHVFALINTHPDADAFQDAGLITHISPRDPASNRPADYVQAKGLWQQQVSRYASNTKVLSNAATAVSAGDPALALQWIKTA